MSAKPYTDEEFANKVHLYLDEEDEERALATLNARDAELAALRAENADLRENFDVAIRFAESLGIHGSESVSEAFTVMCHRWEDAAQDAGELRAELAALRLLYREAVRALQDVEWGPSPASPRSDCPWCLNEMRKGHENDCAITAVLSTPEAQAALQDGQS